jgi:regulator of PEP synthase PpsR (kinase-PPPase family)
MKQHIHLISDSTGETVNSVMRSSISQFEDVEVEEHNWSLVRTQGQLERALEGISKNPGPVLYTIVDTEISEKLTRHCYSLRVPCIPILTKVVEELQTYFGVTAKAKLGGQYALDENYFARVEAIHFTIEHDDGQEVETIDKADVILVGVSRTSKTPTCVYLSYRGINVANIPFVRGIPLPEKLFELKKPLIVGLVIAPERLNLIRKSRLVSLHEENETSYVNIDEIVEEVRESRRIFAKYNWPVIDVTRKSVEETSALIIQLYEKHKEKIITE